MSFPKGVEKELNVYVFKSFLHYCQQTLIEQENDRFVSEHFTYPMTI